MSARRKFLLTLSIVAILFAVIWHSMDSGTLAIVNGGSIEMTLTPVTTVDNARQAECGKSCVLIRASELGIKP